MTLPGKMVYGQMNMLPWLQRFQGLLLADLCPSPPSAYGRFLSVTTGSNDTGCHVKIVLPTLPAPSS